MYDLNSLQSVTVMS